MFLAHKVSLPKWEPHPDLAEGEFQADAITVDLRTVNNTLSFWRCGDTEPAEENIREAGLAMASTMDRANSIDLVWFDKGELEQAGYIVRQTDGVTKVPDLCSHHYDVCSLDYTRLGDLANRVKKAIANGQFHKFRRKQVLDLVVDAAALGRIDTEQLKCTLRIEVQKALDQRLKQ